MSTTPGARGMFHPDVVVVGGGLIGLMCATALGREGVGVRVIASRESGAASSASAGILGPSVGSAPPPVRKLGLASRDRYPQYVQELAERTGRAVPLDLTGIVEIARTDLEAEALRSSMSDGADWLDATLLRDVEPSIGRAVGGAFYSGDGSVDAVALLDAVKADADADPRIAVEDARAVLISADHGAIEVQLESGARVTAPHAVIAAGAWAGLIDGLPRSLPVQPVRGQMLSFLGDEVRHVVMGARGYVVPRGTRVLVGSTVEHVGFDARPTPDGKTLLREVARELAPSLASREPLAHWAGLRPMTPDLLPIVGEDPECQGLFYACGHSKNGVLLAPLTAEVIADVVIGGASAVDASPYAPARFRGARR